MWCHIAEVDAACCMQGAATHADVAAGVILFERGGTRSWGHAWQQLRVDSCCRRSTLNQQTDARIVMNYYNRSKAATPSLTLPTTPSDHDQLVSSDQRHHQPSTTAACLPTAVLILLASNQGDAAR